METGTLPPLKSESSFGFVADYCRTLREVLFEPASFFKNLSPAGGMAGPLAFALVTHWLGSLINYFWSAFITDSGTSLYNRVVQFSSQYSGMGDIDSPGRMSPHQLGFINLMGEGQKVVNWIWGASGILLDPFFTLFFLMLSAVFVYVGARLFVSPNAQNQSRFPRGPTFESTVRILAFATAPAILSGVPYLGTFVAKFIYIPILSIIGAREVYRVTPGRAALIALFPDLLIWGIIGGVALIIALFFLNLASSIFT